MDRKSELGALTTNPEILDSKTSERDDLLIQKLERALHKPTQAIASHDVAKIASEHSAIDLAIVAYHLPLQARTILFQTFSRVDDKVKFIINTDGYTRTTVLRDIPIEEIVEMIEATPPDEAVEVLEDLSERRYRKVIDLLDPNKARLIKEIEKSARNTAGRLMTNEFFSFSMETTIADAAAAIRNHPGIDLTSRFFILDENGALQGYVPSRNLIVNPPHTPLKTVMRSIHHTVRRGSSREEVVDIVERYNISALPVLDEEDRLIGVITYEDVLDSLEDILDETIGSVAGTSEKVSDNEPAFKRFFSRAPWLMVTLLAGLINVVLMSSFEMLEKGMLTFVLFFVPLITGMSGNIGVQCSTILVRGMAMGLITPGHRKEVIRKELILGAFTGLFFGILSGTIVSILDFSQIIQLTAAPASVGLIVGCGLTGACLTGTFLGVLSPFIFSRIGVDPAVASGPIVTAFNDFLSMAIYFLIAIGLSALLFLT